MISLDLAPGFRHYTLLTYLRKVNGFKSPL